MKILVVDDNQDILDTTALVLELDGHEVVTVKDASLIMQSCHAERPDLVLQDAGMPRFDLATHLDAMAADVTVASIPVLIFSALPPAPELLQHPSVVGYLAKPFDLAELRRWTTEPPKRS